MSKDTQKKLRESFRPKLQVVNIAELKKKNPNLRYKAVRCDVGFDPDGSKVNRYFDRGWDVVSTTDNILDDRSLAPKSKEEDKLRVKPMTFRGKGTTGAEFVVLSIPEEQFQSNQGSDMDERMTNFRAKQKVIKKSGQDVRIVGTELNEDTNPSSHELE